MREIRSLVALVVLAAACTAPASGPRPQGVPTETISIRVHEGTTLALDLSPDGRSIVIDLLGQLWQLPAAGGDARALTNAVRDTAEDLDPSWSPRGGRIVFRAERNGRTGLWLTDTSGAAPRQLTQLGNPDGYEGGAAWAPDGRTIAFERMVPPADSTQRWRSRIELLDVSTGGVRELTVADSAVRHARDPAWEPGGGRLAIVADRPKGEGGPVWLVDVATGHATRFAASPARALAPAFSPDGRQLAFFAPDSAGRTQLWAAATAGGAARRLTAHADVTPTRARWTADGQSLVYSADGRLWRVSADGGAPAEIPFTVELTFTRPRRNLPPPVFPEPGREQAVRAFMGFALSPDAKRVAMLALGQLWVMPVGGAARAVAEVPPSAHGLAWSADGGALAWSAGRWREEDVYTTDLASGATTRVTALPGREDHPAYSQDGRQLAFMHEPAEDRAVIRIVSVGAREVTDTAKTRAVSAEPGAEASWTPGSDLLYLTGGFGSRESTRVELIGRSGARRVLGHLDSPLYLQSAAGSVVWLRHARLWRAPMDSTGLHGAPEPLGDDPAMYPSVSRDGSVLYISEGGLRLRSPDARVRRLGWPLRYTPPVAPPILLRNARIIDGTGSPATPPRDLLIERGRISRIAEAGSIAPGAARVVDVAGGWIIPGLIDLHAHVYRPSLLPGYAYFGVTTVRDQGSPIGPLVAYADLIAAGKLEGPRVDYGGIQFYTDWAYDLEDGQGVEPPVDSTHLVRSIAVASAFGSQHIKTRTFRRWDLNARMITEAHRLGMRVTGHCSHPLPLVAAGMDAKEHAGFCAPRGDGVIYEDLVQLFRAAGIGVVPTISYSAFAVQMKEHPEALYADSEVVPFLPERNAFHWMEALDSAGDREYRGYVRQAREAAARWARAGLTIGTGTDIWQVPTAEHMELEEMVKAGLTPLEAIRGATAGSARIIGIERDLGTIEPGKWADLVILDADPEADIRNARRIRSVIQTGRFVNREGIVSWARSNLNGH